MPFSLKILGCLNLKLNSYAKHMFCMENLYQHSKQYLKASDKRNREFPSVI